jgi:hypothetical protein
MLKGLVGKASCVHYERSTASHHAFVALVQQAIRWDGRSWIRVVFDCRVGDCDGHSLPAVGCKHNMKGVASSCAHSAMAKSTSLIPS